MHRRRRHEDRLHQGGRLRSGRLGGAERRAADRRGQRREDRQGARATKPRSCWNGASAISSSACCSPKARRSATPRSMAASSGSVPLVADVGAVKLMVPQGGGEKLIARIVYHRAGAGAGARRASRSATLKVWRGDNMVLEVPLQAAENVERAALPQRAFDAVTEMVIGLFRAGASGYKRCLAGTGRIGSGAQCADDSSPSKAARAAASRPMPRCWRERLQSLGIERRADARAGRLARRRDHPPHAALRRRQAARRRRPRRSCLPPRATITCATPSGRRWRAANG